MFFLKVSLLSILVISSICSARSPVYEINAGLGIWRNKLYGSIGQENTSVNELGLSNANSSPFFYFDVKHNFGMVPNLKIETVKILASGTGTLNNAFSLDGQIMLPTDVASKLQVRQVDLIFYWITPIADFGIKLRNNNLKLDINDQTSQQKALKTDKYHSFPLLYANKTFLLPYKNTYSNAQISYYKFDGSEALEYQLALGWDPKFNAKVKSKFELGYKSSLHDIATQADWMFDLKSRGPYLNVALTY